MTRLLVAALLIGAASPAVACDYQRSVSTDTANTVASQPSNDQSAPAASASDQKPS